MNWHQDMKYILMQKPVPIPGLRPGRKCMRMPGGSRTSPYGFAISIVSVTSDLRTSAERLTVGGGF